MFKDGPTLIQHSEMTCGLCNHHKQFMMKSGEHPEYKHYCNHPKSIEEESKQPHRFILVKCDGKEIGDSDRTPDWCPVLVR